MNIVVVGANHKSCPIELRERLAFRSEHLPIAYRSLQQCGVSESLILSTCNRVEVYASAAESEASCARVAAFLSAHSGVGDALETRLYRYAEPDSVAHLFRVTSGLDSMVLGETDILHQVKHSYELALQLGTTGKTLNALFQKALNAAKAVQARTGVGRGCVSVGTVAIELAQKIFGDLRAYRVLLVGAGDIGELVMQRLADRGVAQRTILNRSLERAQCLAASYGGQAGPLTDLEAQLLVSDIVITSTSATEALVTKATLSRLMSKRRQPAADDLAERRQIGPHAERRLRAAEGHAKSADDLIEDQQRAMLACQRAEAREEPRIGRHEAHVRRDGLEDHARDALAVLAEGSVERVDRIERDDERLLGDRRGHAGAGGEPLRREA